jgi:hypothetical protein
MTDDLRYTPSDCFETFPFPAVHLDSASDDPAETSSALLELRRLHKGMDQAVLTAYGWSDVPTDCGFGLHDRDSEDDALLPDELQEHIDSGDLFFWDATVALDFQGQLHETPLHMGQQRLRLDAIQHLQRQPPIPASTGVRVSVSPWCRCRSQKVCMTCHCFATTPGSTASRYWPAICTGA